MNQLSAEIILAALMELTNPKTAELPRIATIAIATEDVTRSIVEMGWPGPPRELSAAIVTGVIKESHARRDVHSGALRGLAKEVCLMQIHPVNGFWRGITSNDFEAMAGIDYASTARCLTAGALTLRWAARHCLAQHYRTNWREAMWSAYHLGGKCWASPHRFVRAKLQKDIVDTAWIVTATHLALVAEARERAAAQAAKPDLPPVED